MLGEICTYTKALCEKKGFKITVIFLVAYSIFISLYYAYKQQGLDATQMFHPAAISPIGSDTDYIWIFCRLYPFLAILPAGFALFTDRKTKIVQLMKVRVGCTRYYMGKLCAVFFTAFIAFVLPLLLGLALNVIIFPSEATEMLHCWPTYSNVYFMYGQEYLFPDLFFANVYLYYIVFVFYFGICTACVAVFVAGLSTFRIKFQILLFLPYYLVTYILQNIGKLNNYYVSIDFYVQAFEESANKNFLYYSSINLILLCIGVICTLWNGKKNELT
jgi:hypothetical protein